MRKLAPGEPFAASPEGDEVQMQDSGKITKIINRIALGIDRIDFEILAKSIVELRSCAKVLVDLHYK